MTFLVGCVIGVLIAKARQRRIDARLFALTRPNIVNSQPPTTAELGDDAP
jgi:hypothetical protein